MLKNGPTYFKSLAVSHFKNLAVFTMHDFLRYFWRFFKIMQESVKTKTCAFATISWWSKS